MGLDYKRNVYVAVRRARAGDALLAAEFDGKAHIHLVNKDIDNNFNAYGDPIVMFWAALAPGSDAYAVDEARLLVRPGSLVVSVCVCERESERVCV